MDRAGFDPRYSPEYQRGFDPAVHDGPAASPLTHERIPVVEERRRVRPTPIPPVPAPAPAASTMPGAGFFGELDIDYPTTGNDDVTDAVAETPVSPWRNPYLVALTVIGVVLLAAGIGAFRWSVEQVYGAQFGFVSEPDENAEQTYLTAQIVWGLSPLLALAGVLTLLGVVFFVALHWAPRSARDDDDGDALVE
ncbi:nitrogen fixation-related uncharacterized protein [Mycetocola sp. CAN_C7]|uniref:hypothetical protein n=1 Tax=Mycetocola sp. CAN_C7 TaxID=2787724 RepID=UPI0018C9C032